MTIHPDQITAAEAVLKPFVTDPTVSLGGLALQVVNAFMDAAPAKKKRGESLKGEPEGFAAFYQEFPRHVGRREAAQAYGRALTRSSPEIIMAGCKRYKTAMAGTEDRYIKHPASWLNGDHWRDELGNLTLVGGAAVAFEDCGIEAWVRRLEMLAGRDGSARGTWRAAWGPKPAEPGCKVPPEAGKIYRERYPRKAG